MDWTGAAWSQQCLTSVASETSQSEDVSVPRSSTHTMFSIFSKSSKAVIDNSERSVYGDVPRVSHHDVSHVPYDVRSSVSACKEYKRERKKSRSRNFRGLFSSDVEDEVNSVVSDNPQLYHRSCSMVRINISFYVSTTTSFYESIKISGTIPFPGVYQLNYLSYRLSDLVSSQNNLDTLSALS